MLRPARRSLGALVSLVGILAGCGRPAAPLFKLLSAGHTGVTFANTITTSDSFNVQTDVYIYNGAGVGVGDINNDGLPDPSSTGYTTHAVFLDYDGDGDLDLFLLNNSPKDFARGAADTHPLGVKEPSPASWNTLYRNNGDGTFTDVSEQAGILRQIGYGLGVVVADVNRDGRPDIYVSNDVAPNDALYINNGDGTFTDKRAASLKHTSFAGVAATDWSWSALLADFDNDGYKDLFATNGYPKAPNDLDYQTAVLAARRADDHRAALEQLRTLRSYRVANYIFRNNSDLTFRDQTKAWGLRQPGFSYGAAYADLDNDGRLDLVVNNIDATASIYQNVEPRDSTTHYLEVALEGESPNRGGFGATLMLTANGRRQYLYHSPYHGYMSTMEAREHFGLGLATRVDTLEVIWPDGRAQALTGVGGDPTVAVRAFRVDCSSRARAGASSNRPTTSPGSPIKTTTTGARCSSMPTATGDRISTWRAAATRARRCRGCYRTVSTSIRAADDSCATARPCRRC